MSRYKSFGASEVFGVTSNDLGEGPVILLVQNGLDPALLITLNSKGEQVYWRMEVKNNKLRVVQHVLLEDRDEGT